MKQRIRLTESDLHNIIKETINRILKEEYSSNSNEGLTFYLPKSDTTQISHFLRKIAYANNISKDSGCGNIGVNTETVKKRVGDDDIPYLKITVTPSVPEIKSKYNG